MARLAASAVIVQRRAPGAGNESDRPADPIGRSERFRRRPRGRPRRRCSAWFEDGLPAAAVNQGAAAAQESERNQSRNFHRSPTRWLLAVPEGERDRKKDRRGDNSAGRRPRQCRKIAATAKGKGAGNHGICADDAEDPRAACARKSSFHAGFSFLFRIIRIVKFRAKGEPEGIVGDRRSARIAATQSRTRLSKSPKGRGLTRAPSKRNQKAKRPFDQEPVLAKMTRRFPVQDAAS